MASKFAALSTLVDEDRLLLDYYDEYNAGPRDQRKEAEALSYILTKNQETVATGERDRSGSWSASSAGHCLRQQQFVYLGRQGQVPGPDAMNIFRNGDFVHLRYQMVGLVQGWLKDAEVPLRLDQYQVRGTMDGDLGDGVLEIKSINSRGFAVVNEFGPKDDHKKQATAYMLATGYRYTRFIYENKDNNQAREFLYELDQKLADSVVSEWEILNDQTAKKQLLPMQRECLQGKGDFRWCPFARTCEFAKWPKVTLVDD